jgi:hypothetical protein
VAHLSLSRWDRLRPMGWRDWQGIYRIQRMQTAGDDSEERLLAVALLKDAVYWLVKREVTDGAYLDMLRRALAALSAEDDADPFGRVEKTLMNPMSFVSFWRQPSGAPSDWMKQLGWVFVLASLWLATELRARDFGPPVVTGVVRRADELHRRLVESAGRFREVERPALRGIIGFIEGETREDFRGLLELPAVREVIADRAREDPGRIAAWWAAWWGQLP